MGWLRKRLALRSYRRKLGWALIDRYGREPAYSVSQVRVTVEKLGLDVAYIDHAYAAYCGRKLYEEHHAAAGRVCDWAAVRAEVGRVVGARRSSFGRAEDTFAAVGHSGVDGDGGHHHSDGSHH